MNIDAAWHSIVLTMFDAQFIITIFGFIIIGYALWKILNRIKRMENWWTLLDDKNYKLWKSKLKAEEELKKLKRTNRQSE